MKIGLMFANSGPFTNPDLFAHLSQGRLRLGIGSGCLAEEIEELGLDFHKRGAMTDEAIKSMRALWSDDVATFHGKQCNFDRVTIFPKPFNKSGIPIIVGGH